MLMTIREKDHVIFGIRFLSSYYQALDLRRNQLALVPNIYSDADVAAPIISSRNKF